MRTLGRTSLFQTGDFTLASGARSSWKIECDVLTEKDWAGLAVMLIQSLPFPMRFGRVEGVPRGGLPLANALREHTTWNSSVILVVDDVWTTGGSMGRFIQDYFSGWTYEPDIMRAIVFARNPVPAGVVALFQMPASL